MLKIWGRVNSINVQKVMWTVAELKIPHERVDAGMAFGVVNTPEYRAMNPNSRVPTIDYDGFVLWESNVIVRYLYARHGPMRTLEEGYAAEKWGKPSGLTQRQMERASAGSKLRNDGTDPHESGGARTSASKAAT